MKKQWSVLKPDPDLIHKILNEINCYRLTATVLANRGIPSAKEAYRFLNPSLQNIRPPFAIKDMQIAVQRIYQAIMRNEEILIFGDYDVDGITATVMLFDFLSRIHARAMYYIPHRISEGYGLQTRHITEVALLNQIKLIITVDCGSGSQRAIEAARASGIDVIVSDHHRVSDPMPPAAAIVNPNRPDCTAGFENLAGVGVAYCLLICLRKYLRENNFWEAGTQPNLKDYCDLVAIGTIADMVPLIEENRVFVRAGLEKIGSNPRVGIKMLKESSRIQQDFIGAQDIAFRMAPRLNASGRISHADASIKLLLADNLDSASQTAQILNRMNAERQSIEKSMSEDIQTHLEQNAHLLNQSSIVLSHADWHAGVIGIVSSRIAKEYHRPVILISIKDGLGKGSGRSIPGFDMYQGLSKCSSLLEGFGGHSMAAGLKLDPKNIPEFQKQFEDIVGRTTDPKAFEPTLPIDAELNFDEISAALVDELESLSPFGAGNPEPLFFATGIKVTSEKIVGQNHRRMHLWQAQASKSFNAIQFNLKDLQALPSFFDQIAFRLGWNRWNGRKTIQLVIADTR